MNIEKSLGNPAFVPLKTIRDFVEYHEDRTVTDAVLSDAFTNIEQLLQMVEEAQRVLAYVSECPGGQELLDEAKALAWVRESDVREELEDERLQKQKYVDQTIYYRNLAIMLGAKPEQMVDEYDRKLCAGGLDDAAGVAEWAKEQEENWESLEKAHAALDEALVALGEAKNLFDSITCNAAEGPELVPAATLLDVISREAAKGYSLTKAALGEK